MDCLTARPRKTYCYFFVFRVLLICYIPNPDTSQTRNAKHQILIIGTRLERYR